MSTKRTTSTDESTATAAAAALPAEQRGLECRQCGCRHFEVCYTRQQENQIMRVRQCRHCGRRLVTYEKPVGIPPATTRNSPV